MSNAPVSPLAAQRLVNLLGNRLSPVIKARLAAVVNDPAQDTWDDAYSIIIAAGSLRRSTLWQHVLVVDPEFVQSRPSGGRWPRVPSRETILAALELAAFPNG
jgi:hypothetical protein